ncbi:MAG: cytochrome ubiquinol oxidase subunit I [Xanthomonadaceae bacterium]|nr:cytochrome ubiquinol oxidase subunit I [Xanthomonadaceae bacterium]
MSLDPLLLSRIQFGFVISFHILFPAFTIGLASWLAFLEWRWLRTRDPLWRDLYVFWMKIFAVSFGMGVVSGIVMSFQFGTNWSVLSEKAGNVIGPLLSYEVLTAFFMEATFLGVMLFGMKRVSEKLHFFATCMVALGTLISTFWITSANSWMQTPAGYEIVDGVFRASDWWAVIFNPSFPYRLTHMVLAAFLTTCFVIGGVSATYLLRGRHIEAATRMLKLSVAFGAVVVPLQIFAGDLHGLNTLEHQPMKVAAMEGHWRDGAPGEGVPLVAFAIPNQAEERNDYAIEIPRVASLILTHSTDGTIPPLTSVPANQRPPVAPVFFAFRIMVGIGVAMLALVLLSAWQWKRGRLFDPTRARWLLRGWRAMTLSGFVAILAGWYVTEIGRQPYTVYGLLRTADSNSAVSGAAVAFSLAVFALVYVCVFGAGIWYLLKLVRKGPQPHETPPDTDDGEKTPARPLSLPNETLDAPVAQASAGSHDTTPAGGAA